MSRSCKFSLSVRIHFKVLKFSNTTSPGSGKLRTCFTRCWDMEGAYITGSCGCAALISILYLGRRGVLSALGITNIGKYLSSSPLMCVTYGGKGPNNLLSKQWSANSFITHTAWPSLNTRKSSTHRGGRSTLKSNEGPGSMIEWSSGLMSCTVSVNTFQFVGFKFCLITHDDSREAREKKTENYPRRRAVTFKATWRGREGHKWANPSAKYV